MILKLFKIFKYLFIFFYIFLRRLFKKELYYIPIRNDAFGHLIFDLNYILNFNNLKKYRFYFVEGKPINLYLENYAKKKLLISKNNFYYHRISKLFFNQYTELEKRLYRSRDDLGFLKNRESQIIFDKNNLKKANSLLKEINFKNSYISLIIRDQKFKMIHNPGRDFSYHNHRNVPLEKLEKALCYLVKDNNVLRMGNISSNKIDYLNNELNYFDYSNYSLKNDALDLILTSKSDFIVSTGTGLDEIGTIDKIPTLYFGLTDLDQISQYREMLVQPAYLYWKKNKKKLTLRERLSINLGSNQSVKDEIYIHHPEKEYYEASKEFIEIFKDKRTFRSKKINELQERFWFLFRKLKKMDDLYINKNAYISKSFLIEYEDDLIN